MDKFALLTDEEKIVVHDALIKLVDSQDYTDQESVITNRLLQNLEEYRGWGPQAGRLESK